MTEARPDRIAQVPRSSPWRRVRRRLTAVTVASVAVAGVAIAGEPVAAARPVVGALSAGPTVTLPTGDRVMVGADERGRPTYRVIQVTRTGAGSVLSTMRLGGDSYLVPAVARPYLGRFLDPSLFDVTRLAAAKFGDRLPVTLAYTGATAPALPGVILTSSAAGHARGYLTPASAKVFGAALARQAVADSQAGWPDRNALFGALTRIAADLAPVVTPQFPQATLIIKAVDHNGKPLRFGFGLIGNSDDARKGGAFVQIFRGEARLSLPLGHYTTLLAEDSFAPDGVVTTRLGIDTGFTLTTNNQTLTVDTGTATTKTPTISTPRPATVQDLQVEIDAYDARGVQGLGFGFGVTPPQGRLLLTPLVNPAFGRITESTTVTAVDPATPGGRYSYNAVWQDEGVPTDQHHAVPATGLARVDATYSSDRPLRLGGTVRLLLPPDAFFAFGIFAPTPMPLQRTEFVYGPPGTVALEAVLMDSNAFDDPGFVDDFASHLVAPGSRRAQRWFGMPFELTTIDDEGACFGCRSATSMFFALGLHDSQPSHQVGLFTSSDGTPVAHFTVYKDGVLLLKQKDSLGDLFDVPPGSATYRVLSDATRVFQGAQLSTLMTEDVTFASAGGQGNPQPAGSFCPATSTGTGCRVLPVLKAHLDLHATITGGVPVGPSSFDVEVDHLTGAVKTAVTNVSVQVRRSGTATWTALPVIALGGTRYAAAFQARAGQLGQTMDVRVAATDAAGGTLKQTTVRAFVIGG